MNEVLSPGVLALIIPIAGIVGLFGFLTVLVILRFILKLRREKTRSLTDEEERTLRELWKGLQRMEERVSNLETILISREKR
jgi:phage shock protein B